MISLDKIEAFRDEVNKDKFVLSKYKMVNGKNQWGYERHFQRPDDGQYQR